MILSRGLGTHTIPVRLGNPGELVVVDLAGEEAAAGQFDAELQINVARKSGTVEGLGPLGTIAVGLAEVLLGLLEDEVGGVGLAVGLPYLVAQWGYEYLLAGPCVAVPRGAIGRLLLSPQQVAEHHKRCYCYDGFVGHGSMI